VAICPIRLIYENRNGNLTLRQCLKGTISENEHSNIDINNCEFTQLLRQFRPVMCKIAKNFISLDSADIKKMADAHGIEADQ